MSQTRHARHATLTLLLALLTVIPFSAKADGLWGAKASLDINVPGKWKVGDVSTKLYNSGLGFSIGGVYTHYVTDNLFVEPSLSLFYDTYSCDFFIQEGDGFAEEKPVTCKFGVRIPIVAGYTFDITDDFSFSVFTGPELDFAFTGRNRFKSNYLTDNIGTLFGKEDGMQRRISCAWKGGFGFPFSDWRVDIEAAVGISDIIVGPASMKENRFSVSLLRYF